MSQPIAAGKLRQVNAVLKSMSQVQCRDAMARLFAPSPMAATRLTAATCIIHADVRQSQKPSPVSLIRMIRRHFLPNGQHWAAHDMVIAL